MGTIFRTVRFVALALATVAMGRRAYRQLRHLKG